jgi:hypothetical protein
MLAVMTTISTTQRRRNGGSLERSVSGGKTVMVVVLKAGSRSRSPTDLIY